MAHEASNALGARLDARTGRSPVDSAPQPPSRREIWLALLGGLLIALLPSSAAVFRPDRVFMAVDTATSQLPWSGTPEAEGLEVATPALSDQGVCFYPFYRWVSESWRAGDPPAWCPLIYAGAPGFGNAQSGALDPQVLVLVLLEVLGGERGFHYGFAWVGWLRIALAFLGAYLLARRLGLFAAPAALAGVTFAFSGYLILWLNHPLGHVPPLLPWVLYFLEGLRWRQSFGAMAKVAIALALAVYGGHAETAFYVGIAAGLWALAIGREDRLAGTRGLFALALGTGCAALTLIPLTEYLGLSAAQVVRSAEAAELTAHVDFISLGVLFLVAGLLLRGRRGLDDDVSSEPGLRWLFSVVAMALLVVGAILFLAQRGLGTSASLALVPDLLGAPGSGGYRGEGNYIERASPWVVFVALAFALANVFSPRSSLRRRGLVGAIACVSFFLSIELSGLLELFRFVPLVGLGDTVRFAAVGSLGLGLLAGDALQSAPRASRIAAGLALVPLCMFVFVPPSPPELEASVATESDENELLGFVLTPDRTVDGLDSNLEGWWSPSLDFARARARVERIDTKGNVIEVSPLSVSLELFAEPSEKARRLAPDEVAEAPAGAHWFRTPFLLTRLLPDGHWRVEVELFRKGATEPAAKRLARVTTIQRSPMRSWISLGSIVAGLLALVLFPAAPSGLAWLVVLFALGQGAFFARGINPVVPEEMVFPPTRTEALLAEGLGPHRFFSDVGVLPPDTGLVRGLRGIEGYDAMDVAAFNEYRQFALPPGVNPLLAWNPRGVDLEHPVFRLFGVSMLALRDPLDHPDWELVASPEGAKPAETWIYRARDPMPRAFCVANVVSLDELGDLVRRDASAWNPLELASVDADWRPEAPFQEASVGIPQWTNNSVRVDVALDGDGLLVLTDQNFPGWKVYVDGEESELVTADMIFRGVPLRAGSHEVEFRYRPNSIVFGGILSLVSAAGVLLLIVLALKERRRLRTAL